MIRIAIFSVAIMAILLTSVTALTALTTTANNNNNNLNLAFAQTQVGEAILLLSMPQILILLGQKVNYRVWPQIHSQQQHLIMLQRCGFLVVPSPYFAYSAHLGSLFNGIFIKIYGHSIY